MLPLFLHLLDDLLLTVPRADFPRASAQPIFQNRLTDPKARGAYRTHCGGSALEVHGGRITLLGKMVAGDPARVGFVGDRRR